MAWLGQERQPLCRIEISDGGSAALKSMFQKRQTVSKAPGTTRKSLTSPRRRLPQHSLGGGALLPGLVVQLSAVRALPLTQCVRGRLTLRERTEHALCGRFQLIDIDLLELAGCVKNTKRIV